MCGGAAQRPAGGAFTKARSPREPITDPVCRMEIHVQNLRSWRLSRRIALTCLAASAVAPLVSACVLLLIARLLGRVKVWEPGSRFPFDLCGLLFLGAFAALPTSVFFYCSLRYRPTRTGVRYLRVLRWCCVAATGAVYFVHTTMWHGFYFARMGSTDVVVLPLFLVVVVPLCVALCWGIGWAHDREVHWAAERALCEQCGYARPCSADRPVCPECGGG